jgi:hypothetical protein
MSVSISVVDDETDVAELFRQNFRREARQEVGFEASRTVPATKAERPLWVSKAVRCCRGLEPSGLWARRCASSALRERAGKAVEQHVMSR